MPDAPSTGPVPAFVPDPLPEHTFVNTMILMRHAKSGYPDGVADHDRPLNRRGRAEAALAGSFLRNHFAIEEILCSSAARTRQTVRETGLDAPLRCSSDLYDAGIDELLGQIRLTGPQVRTLLVVAHAPGIPKATLALAGPGSDRSVLDAIDRRGFPTSAFAVLRGGSWADLTAHGVNLVDFRVLREP